MTRARTIIFLSIMVVGFVGCTSSAPLLQIGALSMLPPGVAASASQQHPLAKRVSKTPTQQDPTLAVDCLTPNGDDNGPAGPRGKPGKAVDSYLASIKAFIPVFSAKLHTPFGIIVCVQWPRKYSQKGDDYASTAIYDARDGGTGPITRCWIEINPKRLPSAPSGTIVNTVAHELFHCFQGVLLGLPAAHQRPWHDWVVEGQAEWAAAAVAGPDPKDDPIWWRNYLNTWDVALADIPNRQGYKEIGFYAHLQESGIDPWNVIAPMLKARSDAAAFHAAVYGNGDGAAQSFLDSWASGFFRDHKRGKAWDFTGPGIPPNAPRAPTALTVSNGQTVDRSAAAYAQGVYALVSQADLVTVTPTSGHVRLSDRKLDLVLKQPATFCLKSGGCECPAGTTYTGPRFTKLNGKKTGLGLTGGETGASVTLVGQSLDQFCSKVDPCLIGKWNLTDQSSYLSWSLQHEHGIGAFTQFTGTDGTESITFEKGDLSFLEAHNYRIGLTKDDGTAWTVVQDGLATADWSNPVPGKVTFSLPLKGSFTDFLGNSTGHSPVNFFPIMTPWMWLQQPYTCSGSTLKLYGSDAITVPPMTFTRQ